MKAFDDRFFLQLIPLSVLEDLSGQADMELRKRNVERIDRSVHTVGGFSFLVHRSPRFHKTIATPPIAEV